MKESGIGYGAINHPVDRDPVCDLPVLSVINALVVQELRQMV